MDENLEKKEQNLKIIKEEVIDKNLKIIREEVRTNKLKYEKIKIVEPKIKKTANILLVEDDEDDVRLILRTFKESRLINQVDRVSNGREALDFLIYKISGNYPDIILLDLNMPKMDGREFLEEKNKIEEIKDIPVVIMTTSKQEEDILRGYGLGAKSYIIKPVNVNSFIQTIQSFEEYWFEIVVLPSRI